MTETRRLIFFSLSLTALIAVACLVALPHSNVSVAPENLWIVIRTFIALGGLYAVVVAVQFRVRHDEARPARVIRKIGTTTQALVLLGVIAVPFGAVIDIAINLASANSRPLMDAQLAAFDRALGFDWLWFLTLTNSSAVVSSILVFAYYSAMPAMLLVLGWLTVAQKFDRLFEYYAVIILAAAATTAVMSFLPALGAYAYFNPPREMFSNYPLNAGMSHYQDLLGLRSGEPYTLFLDRAKPLVTFPSYHCALAIILMYSARGVRFLFVPILVLEAVMIAATMTVGGHYLIDLIAGAAVACGSILVVRRIAYERGNAAVGAVKLLSP